MRILKAQIKGTKAHTDFGPVHLSVGLDGIFEMTMEDVSFKMREKEICDMANYILDYYDLLHTAS